MARLLKLAVSINYKGNKHHKVLNDYAYAQVKRDMTAMGLPHPKAANIWLCQQPHMHTIQFYWIVPMNGPLHNALVSKIKEGHARNPNFRQLLQELEIGKIWLYELDDISEKQPDLTSQKTWTSLHHTRGSQDNSHSQYAGPKRKASFNPKDKDLNWTNRVKAERVSPEASSLFSSPSGPSSLHDRIQANPESLLERVHPSPSKRRRIDSSDSEMTVDVDAASASAVHSILSSSFEVTQLRQQLQSTRQSITLLTAKEAALLKRLDDLDAGAKAPEIEPRLAAPDSILQARIKVLAQELEAERSRRIEAEGLVKDVQNECRAPFVVPALLDAFAEISKLTSHVLAR